MIDPVVDTWVLEKCDSEEAELSLAAVSLLHSIFRSHSLALDTEGKIKEEYMNHIRPNTNAAKWWSLMVGRVGKFQYYSNHLAQANKSHLLNNLHFDSSDIKFVGVVSKTQCHYLVAEESDYSAKVKAYLGTQIGVKVITVNEALDLL